MDNLDQVKLFYFTNSTRFNASSPDNEAKFSLPLDGDETKRDVIVQWQNTQPELELYLTIDCDASAIVAYKIQITNVHKFVNVTTTVTDY